MISGPIIDFSTSPPWRSPSKTTFPSYRVINDVEEDPKNVNITDNAIEESVSGRVVLIGF